MLYSIWDYIIFFFHWNNKTFLNFNIKTAILQYILNVFCKIFLIDEVFIKVNRSLLFLSLEV